MVASLPATEADECSPQEMVFARLVACEGMRASRAYAIAWRRGKGGDAYATKQAAVVLDRPRVATRIAQLRAAADAAAVMSMAERRRMLAETARAVPKRAKATHGDRIAAIREDAILAGERRTDGTQVSLSVEVTVGTVIGALRGAQAVPVPVAADLTPAQPIVDVATPAASTEAIQDSKAAPRVVSNGNTGDSEPGSTFAHQPVCGPLGVLALPAGSEPQPARDPAAGARESLATGFVADE